MNVLVKNTTGTLIILSFLVSLFFPYSSYAQVPDALPSGGVLPTTSGQGVDATLGQAAASISACAGGGAIGGGIASVAESALFVPVTAPAQNVIQTSQLSKECILDSIVIALRETLIRKVTSSIVTWINSGFDGSPAFVTNIDQFLLDTADEAFGEYVYNATNFAHLCTGFDLDIRFALALQYSSNQRRPTCTLSQIVDNVDTAIDDLSVDWDWDVYQSITTDPSGNRFTSFLQVQDEVSNVIAQAVQNDRDDINRGDGFLSFKECTTDNAYGENRENCKIVTPGSTINEALNQQLGSETRRIELADEFNEILGALIGQLAQQAFGSSGGVAGLSRRSGNSDSFLSQYNQDAQQASSEIASSLSQQNSGNTNQYTNYINNQSQAIQSLLAAQVQVTETFACYTAKNNTWFAETISTDDPLDDEQVDLVDEADRTLAYFVNPTGEGPDTEFAILTPSIIRDRALYFQSQLAEITQQLSVANTNIERARQGAAITESYQEDIVRAGNSLEIQTIQGNYLQNIGSLGIDTNSAIATLSNTQYYAEQLVDAEFTTVTIDQISGADQELALCQAFSQAVISQEEAESITGTDS